MQYGFVSLMFSLSVFGFATSFSDEITIRNGLQIQNCSVSDTTDGRIVVVTSAGTRTYLLSSVVEVVKAPYAPDRVTRYFKEGAEVFPQAQSPDLIPNSPGGDISHHGEYRLTFPRAFLVPVGVALIAISLDYLASASDLQDMRDKVIDPVSLDPINKLSFEKMDATISRQKFVGWTCLIVGALNLVAGVIPEKVKVESTDQGLTMRYNF